VTNATSTAVHEPAGASAPRLVLRFALYTGAVLLAAGLAILWTMDRQVADRAQRAVESQARAVTEENLRSRLVASDFEKPVHDRRLAELDSLFRNKVLIPGIVGTRLFNESGTITYAARHELIGTRVPYAADVPRVFAGHAERRVTHTMTWQGVRNVKVLQSLLPVQGRGTARPAGALELDQDYRAVAISIAGARNRLILILGVAFLVLYLCLFPILRQVTAQLAARNRELRDRAADRERMLEAERAARAEAESIQRLLGEQNDRLRQLDRMKDEFVSLVSHELRTPLTSIRGYVELLLDERSGMSAEGRNYLSVVDRNSERLLELVGDLLFLAQVDAGKLAIELEDVDLVQVVRDSVAVSRPLADARSVELDTTLERVPVLSGDPARLAQVLDNLVSNAIKFTPGGGRVSIRLDADEERVVLEVADTGLGIAAAEQSRLFERFFRSSRATENAIPGTGLGLSITKAIVERHGGRITVTSEEDEGTTVRVELPLAVPDEARAAASELAA
jgi:signal transduction histidine kinase